MAKKFKDYYDVSCARLIAQKIVKADDRFDDKGFVAFLAKELRNKEFFERQDAFVRAFEKYLPGKYSHHISLFESILGEELKTTTGMFTYGWWLWPVGRYVEIHGAENFDVSISFIHKLTKRFTGEFAIRTLLEAYPQKTMKQLLLWSKDSNVHVRRLASEGARLRLPWAKKSYACMNEFPIYKKLLTNLKDDSEKFVQKSVGNNLNDLMKEFPEKAKEIIFEWKENELSKHAQWVINHGLRSERKVKVKKGNKAQQRQLIS